MTGTPDRADQDDLWSAAPLPYVIALPVLGVPCTFRSNVSPALAAVEASFGQLSGLSGRPDLVGTDAVEVRVVEHDGDELGSGRVPIRYRMPDADRILFHTSGSLGLVDVARGDAIAYVTRSLLADEPHFRYGVLEMLTLVLVTARDRYPIHAAMIERDGRAVILAARSGVGKSTLTYQASCEGWRVLADDGVYIQTTPRLRLWGTPGRILLPEDATTWFPELAAYPAELQANGKVKRSVLVSTPWPAAPVVESAVVCVLERDGPPGLERIDADGLLGALIADLERVGDLYGPGLRDALHSVVATGGWRIALSDDPRESGALLDRLPNGAGSTT